MKVIRSRKLFQGFCKRSYPSCMVVASCGVVIAGRTSCITLHPSLWQEPTVQHRQPHTPMICFLARHILSPDDHIHSASDSIIFLPFSPRIICDRVKPHRLSYPYCLGGSILFLPQAPLRRLQSMHKVPSLGRRQG